MSSLKASAAAAAGAGGGGGGGGGGGAHAQDLWVCTDADGWRLARVAHRKSDEEVTVLIDGVYSEVRITPTSAYGYDASHDADLDDVALMVDLHEAPLLDLLRRRFERDVIYTSMSNLLISINPYRQLEGLYAWGRGPVGDIAPKAPHLYTIAGRAYRAVRGGGGRHQVRERARGQRSARPLRGRAGSRVRARSLARSPW